MENISKVAGKGWEWYNGEDPAEATPRTGSYSKMPSGGAADAASVANNNNNNDNSTKGNALTEKSLQIPELGTEKPTSASAPITYWNYAQDAAEQTYSAVTGYWSSYSPYIAGGGGESNNLDLHQQNQDFSSPSKQSNSSLLTSPALLGMFKNPYVDVRGVRTESSKRSSMEAVRTLLRVTSPDLGYNNNSNNNYHYLLDNPASPSSATEDNILESPKGSNGSTAGIMNSWNQIGFFPSPNLKKQHSQPNLQPSKSTLTVQHASPSETASHLAEGTLRAFRDIALDEAVELHSALRYWSYRWERPFISWLEAGPAVWFSGEGYQHQVIGQKVAQIQAVLARRCATIGDLQQHLLRAGWQQGVAHWGVLGDGGEWAAVAGFDGRMPQETPKSTFRAPSIVLGQNSEDDASAGTPAIHPSDSAATPIRRTHPQSRIPRVSSELSDMNLPLPSIPGQDLPRQAPISRISQFPQQRPYTRGSSYYTSISVRRNPGGQIVMDEPALVEWTVDAMSIVRRQLYRAGNGRINLPFTENWAQGDDQSLLSYNHNTSMNNLLDDSTAATNESYFPQKLPLWASLAPHSTMAAVDENPALETKTEADEEQEEHQFNRQNRVAISDLPLLVQEVSEVLDVMEVIMDVQRERRLEKLKPPPLLQRSWYIFAMAIPSIGYYLYKTADKEYGWGYLKAAAKTLTKFCREHVAEPFLALYNEVTKGTDNISDHQARDAAIDNLQKMIRSWLDEMYPDMPEHERAERAKSMDVTLIENQKEASMKTIYELNSVIRMSFIEAQFIKKEMMNALLALDEMRASTNFNMNMAAITPFVLLMYLTKRAFQFVFYATLKLGKSREETYGSFLHILTEIERLLVMRDNPPDPSLQDMETASYQHADYSPDSVLNADDLGMLMLHIHSLRTILWQDRRRFSAAMVRSVVEDLAELAGERGAVSVRQQLKIIERMFRTYPFLRVVTSGMTEIRY